MSITLDRDGDDPWVMRPGSAVTNKPELERAALWVETIEGVEPLDTQFGVFAKKTVPDTLQDALFGQPEPTETEIEAAGGDPAAVPPLQTYAILDAAKVTNLPEFLDRSTLEHRCLFKNDAYDEMKDAAPWIVRLEEGSAFTRNLFTRSDADWHLWDREPGIYVRSRGTLEEMWRHFRKFTRIQDENGQWFYFRFWEPRYARYYYSALSAHSDKTRAWLVTDFYPMHSIGVIHRGELSIFHHHMDSSHLVRSNRVFQYEQPERSAHLQAKRDHFVIRLRGHLCASSRKFEDFKPQRQKDLIWHFIQTAARFGMTIERSVADFAEASLMLWRPLESEPECSRVLESSLHPIDKGKKLLSIARQRRGL